MSIDQILSDKSVIEQIVDYMAKVMMAVMFWFMVFIAYITKKINRDRNSFKFLTMMYISLLLLVAAFIRMALLKGVFR